MSNQDHLYNPATNYLLQVFKAFGNNDDSTKATALIAKSLKDVYRYFEPAFFQGDFFVCKHFKDEFCFAQEKGTQLYDKNMLLNKTDGTIIIQAFDDESYFIWEAEDPSHLFASQEILSYRFNNDKEVFLANGSQIDVTISPKGSRFAPQFVDLLKALAVYKIERIYRSSCAIFSECWHDPKNRMFFRSEGSGNNVPEKFMQQSIFEFLRVQDSLRGISMEVTREFNVNPEQPKPVDLKIQWKEANRVALIEIKWVGAKKSSASNKTYYENSPRAANPGYVQLKGYYDSAQRDMANTIIKAHLVVIDARRNNLKDESTSITYADGMHYENSEMVIDEDKQYYKTIPGFEAPIRMFATPITN